MEREIGVREVGRVLWVVYLPSMNLADSKRYDLDEEAKAWKRAEKVAKMAGCKVEEH